MKRLEQLSHFNKLSLADLRKEISDLEAKIQSHKVALAFGKTKVKGGDDHRALGADHG